MFPWCANVVVTLFMCSFGMYHDTEKIGCHRRVGSTLHVMTPIFEADTVEVAWSRCSQRDLTNFLEWVPTLLHSAHLVVFAFCNIPNLTTSSYFQLGNGGVSGWPAGSSGLHISWTSSRYVTLCLPRPRLHYFVVSRDQVSAVEEWHFANGGSCRWYTLFLVICVLFTAIPLSNAFFLIASLWVYFVKGILVK